MSLCVHLGHPAALLVLNLPPDHPQGAVFGEDPSNSDVWGWLARLGDYGFGDSIYFRASAAICGVLSEAGVEAEERYQPHVEDSRRALAAAERWLACPCDACWKLVAGFAGSLRSIGREELLTVVHADDPTEEQLQALDDAKETSYRIGGAFVSAVSKFVSAISPAISLPTPQDATAQCAYLAGRVITLATVRDRVREELLPWALGYSDPVRERVEGRQREAAE